MKLELKKVEGKTVGYSLVPENITEQYALNDLRNNHYYLGFDDTSIQHDSPETSIKTGNEMVTRMNFLKYTYHYNQIERAKVENVPVVDKNQDTPVDTIRKQCFAIVREHIRNSHDQSPMEILMNISLQHKELPVAYLVIETYLGIIGFHNWLVANEKCPISFINDAIHDLTECIQHDRNDGYIPRTSNFVKFYKLTDNTQL